MNNKKNKGEWLYELLLVGIVAIMVIIAFAINYVEEIFNLTKYILIINISITIFMPAYYLIYNIIERRKTKKIENSIIIDKINYEYFRDIIKEYSPAVLSILYDGKMEFSKDLGACIIYLINKGYLKILQNDYIVPTEKNCSDLPVDLQILAKSDVNHLLAMRRIRAKTDKEKDVIESSSRNMNFWNKTVEREIVDKGLATNEDRFHFRSILVIIVLLEIIYTINIGNDSLLLFSIFVLFGLLLLKSLAYDNNKFVKTKKGYEIYSKLVGLKKYINDFSSLSEKQIKEIELWEDYMIYAIILNNKSKLSDQSKKFIKRVANKDIL